jgi:hypothetical protein
MAACPYLHQRRHTGGAWNSAHPSARPLPPQNVKMWLCKVMARMGNRETSCENTISGRLLRLSIGSLGVDRNGCFPIILAPERARSLHTASEKCIFGESYQSNLMSIARSSCTEHRHWVACTIRLPSMRSPLSTLRRWLSEFIRSPDVPYIRRSSFTLRPHAYAVNTYP